MKIFSEAKVIRLNIKQHSAKYQQQRSSTFQQSVPKKVQILPICDDIIAFVHNQITKQNHVFKKNHYKKFPYFDNQLYKKLSVV